METRAMRITAKITDLGDPMIPYYYAHCESECRDKTDKSAFAELLSSPHDGPVTMGKIIVELVRIDEE